MRLTIVLVAVAVVGLMVAATTRTNSRAPLPAADTSVTLEIDGMVCTACAGRVEALVREMDGVRSATVKLETGEARIDYDSTKTTSDALASRIAKEGFKAALVKSEPRDPSKE